MKNATILILVVLLVTLALFGFGACQVESPGVSVSWQNDSQAQETERLRISETQRTERVRIEAANSWQPWAALVALAVVGAAGFVGYNRSRRPVAPVINVCAPPPAIAAWLVQNPGWYFDGNMLANPARRELRDVSSIPTTRRLTG